MSFSRVNIGTAANDGTGESGPRGWLAKINDNFDAVLKPSRSVNLFDKFAAETGFSITAATGELVANAEFFISGLIPVKPSTHYSWSPAALPKVIAFYDANQNFIATASVNTQLGVTSTSTSYFMRTSARLSEWTPDNYMVVEGSSIPGIYQWFHGYDFERQDNRNAPNGYAGLDENGDIPQGMISSDEPSNLFNKATVAIGFATQNNSGDLVANAEFFASDFIEVKPSTQYSYSPSALPKYTALYDDEKNYIATVTLSSSGFTTTANTGYVRVSARLSEWTPDNYMVVKGATLPSQYEAWEGLAIERRRNRNAPGGYAGLGDDGRLPQELLPDNSGSPLAGKIIAALGDSITYGFIPRNYDGYPGQLQSYLPLIAEELGASYLNYGISGSTLGDNGSDPVQNSPFTQRYATMSDDADLVIVMGGTNDCRKNVPLGVFGDTTDKTFFGALYVLCTGLLQKYRYTPGTTVGATKKIMFMTAPKLLKASTPDGLDDLLPSYNEATKQVCAFFSIPVFDAYNLSGLTPHLFRTLQGTEPGYTDMYNPYQTDGIHPTSEGHAIWAKSIAGFVRGLY